MRHARKPRSSNGVAKLAKRAASLEPRPRLRMMLSSAGRRVGLLRSFRSSAHAMGLDFEIFACDVHPEWSAACMEADYAFTVPPATSPEFLPAIAALCEAQAISLVVPTIDTELMVLSEARDSLAAAGVTVAVGSAALIAMARDKLATARFLAAAAIPSPWTVSADHVLEEDGACSWPLLAKPRHGSSGRGVQIVKGRDELARLSATEPYVVQEILEGREFTVNMFFDRTGTLRSAVPHQRLKIRAGEVEKGVTRRDPALCDLARTLASTLDRPFGAMCFQAMVADDGVASIFEINARFGGGYPLAHRAGANFSRWLLEDAAGLPSSMNDNWRSELVMLRYDDAVFV